MNARPFALLVASMLAGAGASAQTVYRCGNEYTTVPCSEGKAVDIDNSAAGKRSAEARQVATRERRLADEMARDRRAREAALKPAGAASLGPVKANAPALAASASKKPKKKAKVHIGREGDFVAAVPKAKKN